MKTAGIRTEGALEGFLPAALAAAILANVLVAWSPQYWPTSVGITGLTLVAILWAVSGSPLALPLATIPVAAIGAWGPLQLLFHVSVLPPITLRSSLVWIMCAVTFILASQILRDRPSRHAFLRIMLWTLAGLAVTAMLQAYNHPVRVFGIFRADDSVVGTLYYKNHFAALMELAAPLALWEVWNGKVIAGGTCFAVIFAATVTSLSRAGAVGVLAELAIFMGLVIFGRRLPMKTGLAIAGALILLAAGGSMVAGTEVIWDRMTEANPYQLRRQMTRSTIEMIKERPWTGFGMGTWRPLYPRFALFDDGLIVNEAHNDLAQWAAEGGLPFLLLMTVLTLWLARRIFQSIWALGMLATFIHCYVDYALRAPPLMFLWFALAGALTQFDARSERRR